MPTLDATREAVAACAIDAVKIYGKGDLEVRALDGVTVDFPVQQLTAVMGPSGSGKSTLMHCLAGLDSLTSGTIQLGGIDLSTMTEKQRTIVRRDHVGFVFQAFNLLPTLTCGRERRPACRTSTECTESGSPRVAGPDRDCDRPGGPADRQDHLPERRSRAVSNSASRWLVALARAIDPAIVLVPTSRPATSTAVASNRGDPLDPAATPVDELRIRPIVMVTHDPNAASYGGRVLFLADGRIVGEMLDPTVGRVLERLKNLGD